MTHRRCGREASLVEQLESRQLLSTVMWDGGGGDLSWDNPLNWSGDVLPGPADDVVIAAAGTPVITLGTAADRTIASLRSVESLDLSAGSLTVAGDWRQSAPLMMSGGTIGGAGDLVLNGDAEWSGGTIGGTGRLLVYPGHTLTIDGDVTLSRDLVNNGAVVWESGDIAAEGAVITIAPRRTFTAASAGVISDAVAPSMILNFGKFERDGDPAATTTVAVTFNNEDSGIWRSPEGVVSVKRGTLAFTSTVVQKDGVELSGGMWYVSSSMATLLLPGPDIQRSYATVLLNGQGAAFPQLEHASRIDILTLQGGRAFTFDRVGRSTSTSGMYQLTINSPGRTTQISSVNVYILTILGGDVVVGGTLIDQSYSSEQAISIAAGSTLTLAGNGDLGGASVIGAGLLRISGAFYWMPQSGEGPGQVLVTATGHVHMDATLGFASNDPVLNRRIVNYGTIDLSNPSGYIRFGSELVNRGTLNIQSFTVGPYIPTNPGWWFPWPPSIPPVHGLLNNLGTINVFNSVSLGGGGFPGYPGPDQFMLSNRGTVHVQHGNMNLFGVGGGGNWILDAGTWINAYAGVAFTGATIASDGAIYVYGPQTWTDVTMSGAGAVVGEALLTLAGICTIDQDGFGIYGGLRLADHAVVHLHSDLNVPIFQTLDIGLGELDITGNLTLSRRGTLKVASADASTHGTLNVSGALALEASLSGHHPTLEVDFSWPATPGVTFDFLTDTSHTGVFGDVLATGLGTGRSVWFGFTGEVGSITVV